MIKVFEVTTKKQRKQFVELPLKMYKKCPYFIPPLYADEMSIFTDKNVYFKTCESVFFLAEKDGEIVGRIQGIIQKQYNEIHSEKRVRFTRFDSINDTEVALELFKAVENWAKKSGMDTVCGPLGYSDLEREGLLIEGFQELSTFEEQYNYDYYASLIESAGYKKEVDWLEYKIYNDPTKIEKIKRIAAHALRFSNLHVPDTKMSKKQFIEKYKDGIFNVLDECYKHLYGVVPFTEEMKKQMIDNFYLIVEQKYVMVVCDKNEKVVAFALCFPGIGKSLQKSGGRLTPITLLKLFKEIKKPGVLDLALIGVLPEYQSKGINSIALSIMIDMLNQKGIDHCETNLNLEDNVSVQAQWKYFKAVQHKRRRSYIKSI